ncbi:hypothetical protein BJV74DRAFT_989794 [Russula compacta]|nr:hypothetical protein BJV74DRAFT_989794 [Russula compacta]
MQNSPCPSHPSSKSRIRPTVCAWLSTCSRSMSKQKRRTTAPNGSQLSSAHLGSLAPTTFLAPLETCYQKQHIGMRDYPLDMPDTSHTYLPIPHIVMFWPGLASKPRLWLGPRELWLSQFLNPRPSQSRRPGLGLAHAAAFNKTPMLCRAGGGGGGANGGGQGSVVHLRLPALRAKPRAPCDVARPKGAMLQCHVRTRRDNGAHSPAAATPVLLLSSIPITSTSSTRREAVTLATPTVAMAMAPTTCEWDAIACMQTLPLHGQQPCRYGLVIAGFDPEAHRYAHLCVERTRRAGSSSVGGSCDIPARNNRSVGLGLCLEPLRVMQRPASWHQRITVVTHLMPEHLSGNGRPHVHSHLFALPEKMEGLLEETCACAELRTMWEPG